jgi:transcriptional regulator with XRE-family HTH domain
MSGNLVDLTPAISSRIKQLRELRYMTQSDLADRAGVSPRTVYELESGRRARLQVKTMMLLAEALELSYESLISESGPDPTSALDVDMPPRSWLMRRRYPVLALGGVLVLLVALLATSLLVDTGDSRLHWVLDDNAVVVRESIDGRIKWRHEFDGSIRSCDMSPWSPSVLLVTLADSVPAGGRLEAWDMESDLKLWSIRLTELCGGSDVNAQDRAIPESQADSIALRHVAGANWTSAEKRQPTPPPVP